MDPSRVPYQQQRDTDSIASPANTAVDFNTSFGNNASASSSTMPPNVGLHMPLVYPILAKALGREGFPGFGSLVEFQQDQLQLEQVAVQSSLEHQQYSSSSAYEQQQQQHQQQQHQHQPPQHTAQDDTYLLSIMMMAQNTNESSGVSFSQSMDPTLQDPNSAYNNLMGDMQPLEIMQYNSLMLDGHYFDELPYSMIQGGCGADGPGMDPTSLCDSPQAFNLGGANYFDQYSQPINIHQHPQPHHLQQQATSQQGYFDPSMSMSSGSGSSSASSSSSGSSSSSSAFVAPNYGFNFGAWGASSGLLYQQGDFLLERKREGTAGMPGHHSLLPGAAVQPHLESAEGDDSDDDDDDGEEFGDEDGHGLMPSDQTYGDVGFQSAYPGDDSNVPPLSMPNRSSRRASYGQKHERTEDNIMSSGKRLRSDTTSSSSSSSSQRRVSGPSTHGSHSRNSSMSSINSHNSILDNSSFSSSSPPTSLGSSSSSSSSSSSFLNNGKAPRQQADTIEKRMHPCTFEGCHKSFTRAFNLRSHLNTHNGERPHKCPEPGCDWDFVRRHDLDRHVKSKHMANKPYACRHCPSRFGRSDALQRHRRLENHM
ncbi:hypothetical protein BX616_002342 [Lobosporangium transversale]|nr:hypothetical protein BX616_002342 [Lobosporangium transversale]